MQLNVLVALVGTVSPSGSDVSPLSVMHVPSTPAPVFTGRTPRRHPRHRRRAQDLPSVIPFARSYRRPVVARRSPSAVMQIANVGQMRDVAVHARRIYERARERRRERFMSTHTSVAWSRTRTRIFGLAMRWIVGTRFAKM